ncbi:hypothetical protein Dhaf_2882 [Desulfitobacterium hafniense DCB-2]|nr:hypothetical protein Dhaf_2882 [Desulfitobacterium hafniense DCB-2]
MVLLYFQNERLEWSFLATFLCGKVCYDRLIDY